MICTEALFFSVIAIMLMVIITELNKIWTKFTKISTTPNYNGAQNIRGIISVKYILGDRKQNMDQNIPKQAQRRAAAGRSRHKSHGVSQY